MAPRTSRGFTLIEVMIAAALAAALAAAAFSAIAVVQNIAGTSARAASMGAEGRTGLDIMGRDIRNAGDSLQAGVANCLGAPGVIQANAEGISQCPAVLEPHPWRLTLARYVWQDGDPANGIGPDGSTFGMDDIPRDMVNAALNDNGNNVVSYEFVPDPAQDVPRPVTDYSVTPPQGRQAWFGRIDRVVNPFAFPIPGGNPITTRSVLIDNVELDDALIVDATTNPPTPNLDVANSLFTYQVAYRPGELAQGGNDPVVTGTLLSPPLRFFAVSAANQPRGFDTILGYAFGGGLPYAGIGYDAEVAGFLPFDGAAEGPLLSAGITSGVIGNLGDPTSDVRYLIDRNRFRAVRVTFRVHEGRDPTSGLPLEDPRYRLGLDVDGDIRTGTAHVVSFQATFAIKSNQLNALQYESGGAL
jgi:prepilin-type N-terminal cleavage/methylation domain-containing protein